MSTGVRVVGATDGLPEKPEKKDDGSAEAKNEVDNVDALSDARPADEADDGDIVDAEVVAPAKAVEPEAGGRSLRRPPHRSPEVRRRRRVFAVVCAVAVLGVAGTIGFGLAWSGLHAQEEGEAQASGAAKAFLTALTNFDAKTVDADFSAITAMATGDFASQAGKFFNSSIRQELENALASSRGQIRSLYVESYSPNQASVYAVVDQLYVNNKITSPQSDVLRIVVSLTRTGGGWKISDVTVLEGPSLGSGTSAGTSASTSTTTTTAPAG